MLQASSLSLLKSFRLEDIVLCVTDFSFEIFLKDSMLLYKQLAFLAFFANDHIEDYGIQIHERLGFILKLLELSPYAHELDFWRKNSTPYKIWFYATAEQIYKFTFDLEQNTETYIKFEEDAIRKWMLINAVDRVFDPCRERYIYIRDDECIRPEHIIRCERILVKERMLW